VGQDYHDSRAFWELEIRQLPTERISPASVRHAEFTAQVVFQVTLVLQSAIDTEYSVTALH
jgi:hypothetical protein